MACFLVPAAEAVAAEVAKKANVNKEAENTENISLSTKLSCCVRGRESQACGEPTCGPGGKLISAARWGLLQARGLC